jgi:Leucine-rich repeat (LRR) protein
MAGYCLYGCSPEHTEVHDRRLPAADFYIPDINLEAAIREELGKSHGELLTVADMEQLVDLIAENKGIEDLRGLEYAVNLVDLRLCSNRITDLVPLGNLTAVYRLHLSNNNIIDITPLSSLPYLEDLKLDGNNIVDISLLSNNKSLRWVDLSSNEIADISVLATNIFPLLEYVDLSGNELDMGQEESRARIEELLERIPDLRY